jgi:nitroreductase
MATMDETRAAGEQERGDHAFETIRDVVTRRMSVRKLAPDPIPDGWIEEILDTARWAMSGANSQPWEYIVVTDPAIKQELYEAYMDYNNDFIFWMEQQRRLELRHPSYIVEGDPHEVLAHRRSLPGWAQAPALVCVVGDGRKQWGTVQGAHTFGRHQTHLSDSLSNTCTLIHLAAAAKGLGAQWVTIHLEEPFKRILNVPDLYTFFLIIPIGFPAVESRPGIRRPLEDLVHRERFDSSRFMSNEAIVDYLYALRQGTRSKYVSSWSGPDVRPGGDG